GIFVQWLRNTFLGWLLGVVLTIIAILAVDAIGVQGTQFLIGAGMGMGVGYVQARTVRRLFGESGRWLWVTVLGMALPFVVFDLTRILGAKLGYSLPLCVAAGGVLVGALQRGILRLHSERANWWIPASVVGWLLAAGTVVLNDRYLQEVLRRNLPGVLGALIYLGVILSGGLALGAVTGGALRWMLRTQSS
ncbi:hypothetical protein HUU05_21050, partial [candidate division KSB1 bacterium]|nr:hypothetical protein [candidate division KSB1 bacterium]